MNTVIIPNNLESITEVFESEFQNLIGSDHIKAIRKKAFSQFQNLGFPSKSNEEYKYSGTEKLFKEDLHWVNSNQQNQSINFEAYRKNNAEANHVFLVNGKLNSDESDLKKLQEGFIVCDLKHAAAKHPELFEKYFGSNVSNFNDAFAQLNLAMANQGLFIYVAQNTKISKPIQINNIVSTSTYSILQTHHIIVAENFAEMSIVETYNSLNDTEAYFLNTLAEVSIGENAAVNYYKLQNEHELAVQINTTQVVQNQHSHFDTNTVTLGGKWLRNNLNIILNGIQCESHLNGLQILKKQQHVDNHSLVDHQMPHCQSSQLYKGILKDKSTGVFNGKIFVRKDAQKTNAYQSSKNMLLSNDATMNTKPQLEIYADDVKCSHGSSTGQIDENALFYLQSRGLSPDSAKALLMYAFAVDVIHTIKIESYKNYLNSLIEACFE